MPRKSGLLDCDYVYGARTLYVGRKTGITVDAMQDADVIIRLGQHRLAYDIVISEDNAQSLCELIRNTLYDIAHPGPNGETAAELSAKSP